MVTTNSFHYSSYPSLFFNTTYLSKPKVLLSLLLISVHWWVIHSTDAKQHILTLDLPSIPYSPKIFLVTSPINQKSSTKRYNITYVGNHYQNIYKMSTLCTIVSNASQDHAENYLLYFGQKHH